MVKAGGYKESWVTETVNTVVVDEQWKTRNQGLQRPNRPRSDDKCLPYGPGPVLLQGQNSPQPMEQRCSGAVEGWGPSPNVISSWFLGRDDNTSNPIWLILERGGESGHQPGNHPQLKTERVLEEGGGTNTSNDPSEQASGAGEFDRESQWESVMEGGGFLHNHEDTPQVDRISIADIVLEPDSNDQVDIRVLQENKVTMEEDLLWEVTHPRIDRQRCSKTYESCLVTYIGVNGIGDSVLFNLESLADAFNQDFALAEGDTLPGEWNIPMAENTHTPPFNAVSQYEPPRSCFAQHGWGGVERCVNRFQGWNDLFFQVYPILVSRLTNDVGSQVTLSDAE